MLDLVHDGLLLVINMHFNSPRTRILVPAADASVNLFVFLNKPYMLAHILDVFQAVSVHLLGKVSHHLGQLFIPAPLYNNIVKRNVGFRYLYCVLGPGDL